MDDAPRDETRDDAPRRRAPPRRHTILRVRIAVYLALAVAAFWAGGRVLDLFGHHSGRMTTGKPTIFERYRARMAERGGSPETDRINRMMTRAGERGTSVEERDGILDEVVRQYGGRKDLTPAVHVMVCDALFLRAGNASPASDGIRYFDRIIDLYAAFDSLDVRRCVARAFLEKYKAVPDPEERKAVQTLMFATYGDEEDEWIVQSLDLVLYEKAKRERDTEAFIALAERYRNSKKQHLRHLVGNAIYYGIEYSLDDKSRLAVVVDRFASFDNLNDTAGASMLKGRHALAETDGERAVLFERLVDDYAHSKTPFVRTMVIDGFVARGKDVGVPSTVAGLIDKMFDLYGDDTGRGIPRKVAKAAHLLGYDFSPDNPAGAVPALIADAARKSGYYNEPLPNVAKNGE